MEQEKKKKKKISRRATEQTSYARSSSSNVIAAFGKTRGVFEDLKGKHAEPIKETNDS